MAKVTVTKSMSLDGYVTGPDVSMEHPMGVGGERLHDWLFQRNPTRTPTDDPSMPSPWAGVNEAQVKEVFEMTGAVILGKRTFDVGLQHWGDTPYPAPTFVLTHEARPPLPQSSANFVFVNDGIESALQQAKAAAGDRNIMLMGVDITQQYIKASLVDEIEINLVPVLLGKGVRLFEHLGVEKIELEQIRVLEAAEVTHLKFRVVK